jgi:hypothetical protein
MLEGAFLTLPHTREGKNRHSTMVDIAQAAFAVFFCESSTFLAHQPLMEKAQGRSNIRTLFANEKVSATITLAFIWLKSTRFLCASSTSTPLSISTSARCWASPDRGGARHWPYSSPLPGARSSRWRWTLYVSRIGGTTRTASPRPRDDGWRGSHLNTKSSDRVERAQVRQGLAERCRAIGPPQPSCKRLRKQSGAAGCRRGRACIGTGCMTARFGTLFCQTVKNTPKFLYGANTSF